jgi:hypothetical protein
MPEDTDLDQPSLGLAVRTLLLAGYEIEKAHRQPTHAEIHCTGPMLTVRVPLLIALTAEEQFSGQLKAQLQEVSSRAHRSLVMVSAFGADGQLGWAEFLDTMGGPVPAWRALDADFSRDLITAGSNAVPTGMRGEAWRIFEMLAADGFEFAFGRRVRRLGGGKRGTKVSDMLGQLPEGPILVIDAKATATAFDAAIFNLRPLAEYMKVQRLRQRGYNDIHAALVISNAFEQAAESLLAISREFLSDVGHPVCFMTAAALSEMIETLRIEAHLRRGIRWRKLFAGGLVSLKEFELEVKALKSERY